MKPEIHPVYRKVVFLSLIHIWNYWASRRRVKAPVKR